ncbi:MAG: recombination protein O N-terminal domain-containing protein [Verrucomicrobia bacterium]|nr:recombination protein O N-terminal domain-containing protein [Verrucomicrobiota bacterium]
MSPRNEQIEALVLRRGPHGEKMLALELFSAELGLITGYWRIPSALGKGHVPDLFDRGQFGLQFKASERMQWLRSSC